MYNPLKRAYFGGRIIFTYILTISGIFAALALWFGIKLPQPGGWKDHCKCGASISVELTVCSLGYSVYLFIVALAIGIAAWLILLILVYLPAGFLHNMLGADLAKTILTTVNPIVHRSSHSPGILNQPILDYTTITVIFLAPAFAVWTTVKKYNQQLSLNKSVES